ncbi:MAG: hypothetical protein ABW128_06785 [Rhizorhabdus sp.]
MHFSTSSAPLPVTLVALGADSPVVFLMHDMTQSDMDRLGYELFRHNIVPISQETFRATLIDEIFNVYGDEEGETFADMMDGYWQSQDLYTEQMDEWRYQEEQRLLDEANGAPKRAHAPVPQHTLSVRERSKAQLFSEALRGKSMRVRELTIEMQTYDLRQREGMARLVIEEWRGLKAPFAKQDGFITDASWIALKNEVGSEAMNELYGKIFAKGAVTETEKGNSDSPLGTTSPPSGSPEPSDGSASSDGSSATAPTSQPSSTTHAQPAASAETIEPSSNSTFASDGETRNGDTTLTDAHTSTNQSA